MFKRLKFYLLMKLYRVLVVKVYTIDRAVMGSYPKFHTFCDLEFNTNQGLFSFSFKEDRRSSHHGTSRVSRTFSSYLVELEGPGELTIRDSPLHNKVIVVVMLYAGRINYEALARVLLDLYIDQFTPQ